MALVYVATGDLKLVGAISVADVVVKLLLLLST